jgi:hypothetical protein
MMIPVRVPVDAPLHLVGGIVNVLPPHPLAEQTCPACDDLLSAAPVTLVYVGTDPATRASGKKWVTGGAVAVHAACAGLTEPAAVDQAVAGDE